MSAKILVFDIETAPSIGFYFNRWKEGNIVRTKEESYILSFAYKWLGVRSPVQVRALPDYADYYRKHKNCDKRLVSDLWSLLDEADVTIAHNADRFDLRTASKRFIFHSMKPPSPYKSIDTLKIAKKHANFESNNLDELARYLGLGRKVQHPGFDMWQGCMEGDEDSWNRLKRYNIRDVVLLERVYLRLRPYATSHPHLTNYTRLRACPTCQSKNIQHRGVLVTKTGYRARIQCNECGAWSSGIQHIREVVK